MENPKIHKFQAQVNQVLSLVINSLYSNKEIFLRELISNASDALDRLRFQSIQKPELTPSGHEPSISLIPDADNKTLTVADNGAGMTAEELEKNLGTIAWSGTREFAAQLKQAEQAGNAVGLIGQFGVGFYSAFLVASRVEVVSRAAGQTEAWRWSSSGEEGFSIDKAERSQQGTSVVLHLKDDQLEYLEPHRLRALVSRYSDYIAHRIELIVPQEEGAEPKKDVVNQGKALWQRPAKEISKEQYVEFYKHLSHDWEEPLAYRHFQIEGTLLFTGLIFIPKRPPLDLFHPEMAHGVRLHVKRVMVMEHCEELVPRWLRFVRGVVDTEDLPLNVSRELLQDSKAVRVIYKQVVQQTLDALNELAEQRPEDYELFWKAFGAVLKEGFHFEPEYKEKLSKLVRYESSKRPGLVSLAQYREAMHPDQPAIYFASGVSRQVIENSPHLEALRQREYEVLIMSDPIDPFAVTALEQFDDKPFLSVMEADLKLEPLEENKERAQGDREEAKTQTLLERFGRVLEDKVEKVVASKRLTDSPACLVIPQGGIAPHIERMLRAQKLDAPLSKRILEVNLEHPVLRSLAELDEKNPGSERVVEWIELIYEQALLAEGSPLENPGRFAQRLSRLLGSAAKTELST